MSEASWKQTELHAGELRFSAAEQGEGPIVLCLHGFPDHGRSFRFQLPALAAAGFHAIAPTLRGYEPSSQPRDGDYHLVRMVEDVLGWVDHLGSPRVHLVGHDWGAVIGYLTCARAPQRFLSLTTMAVTHPGSIQSEGIRRFPSQLRKSWYMFFFQLRGLADYLVERNDWALIEKLWRDWSPGWSPAPEEMAALKETLRQPGVKAAALGYYRAAFDPFSAAARETMRLSRTSIRVPTLAFTGAGDGCMDTRLYDALMRDEDFPAGLEVVRIAAAGHFLHQEKPDEINRRLIDWFNRHAER